MLFLPLPPLNGMNSSIVPWKCRIDTGRFCWLISVPTEPATGAMAAMRSESSEASR